MFHGLKLSVPLPDAPTPCPSLWSGGGVCGIWEAGERSMMWLLETP
jgi:hypothetical protein